MPITNTALAMDLDQDSGHGWLILKLQGQSFAINGTLTEGVYLSAEATVTLLEDPPAYIEVHRGRPWFILPAVQVLRTLGTVVPNGLAKWTLTFRTPASVAVHADAIEGPYRGVVMNGTLKTSQGNWPVIEPMLP